MGYTNEQIERARNTSIIDYARANGYDCEPNGKDIRIHGLGACNVDPRTNKFYMYKKGEGGIGCISFLMKAVGMTFPEAMRCLVGEGDIKYMPHINRQESEAAPKKFIKPEKLNSNDRMIDYLSGRGLSAEIINEFIKAGILYEGKYETEKNGVKYITDSVVFLCKNESNVETGAIIQGLNGDHKFKRNMGYFSDYSFVKGEPDTVYLFESPIDLMSFVQLHPEINNAKFVAMGGLNPKTARKYIDEGYMVISCVDNDIWGRAFNDRLLMEKMCEVWGGEYVRNSASDREPPIVFLTVDNGGGKANLFLSKEDFADYGRLCGDNRSAFIFHNRTNFQVNAECKIHSVKDFNDLLKLKTDKISVLNEISERTKKISEAVDIHRAERTNGGIIKKR